MKQELLRITDLKKTYGSGIHALKGINITIHPGDFTVIIGPSGAGKSTLIRCINRLTDPTAGSIIFDGTRMERLRGAALRAKRSEIGMIFQHYNLIGRVNVIKNVLHGRLGKIPGWKSLLNIYSFDDKLKAFELLQKVGLEEKIHQRVDTLSGGQMQRVGICRAIIQNPKLLLADEPIASLDPKSAHTVMKSIQQISRNENLSCVVNLHQVEFARTYANRIIGLKDGLVVFDGKPDELNEEIISLIYEGKEDQMYLTGQQDNSEEYSVIPVSDDVTIPLKEPEEAEIYV